MEKTDKKINFKKINFKIEPEYKNTITIFIFKYK